MKNSETLNAEMEIWNSRYDRPDFLFGSKPNTFFASHESLFEKGKRALAVADGEGRNSVWLAGQGLKAESARRVLSYPQG